MQLDDELCLCFHVRWRKVLQFLKLRRPAHASQLSECGGAGTGCGWCRQELTRLWNLSRDGDIPWESIDQWLEANSPSSEGYSEGRQVHRKRVTAAGKIIPQGDPLLEARSDPSAPTSDSTDDRAPSKPGS